jgi:hypothetical protein
MATEQRAPGRPREWDAAGYDALPLPHERWGRRLLDTLPLTGTRPCWTWARVPAGQRAEAVRRVAARLPEPAVDYVRLQASARRPV